MFEIGIAAAGVDVVVAVEDGVFVAVVAKPIAVVVPNNRIAANSKASRSSSKRRWSYSLAVSVNFGDSDVFAVVVASVVVIVVVAVAADAEAVADDAAATGAR